MKVKVKDLRPNPYRDIEHYPIDEFKVQALVDSMEQTGFWENILAREVNGVIQIAYGHHRLEALKRVKKPNDVIDIPVHPLDDYVMIQVMANENMDQWKMLPFVIHETVKVAREFLNTELAKYETWEDITSNKFIKGLFDTQRAFETTKGMGTGSPTIAKFLGKGWNQSMVQNARQILLLIYKQLKNNS